MVDGPWSGWDFPRGSSMTVSWVSICKNGADFLFLSASRQKTAGQGHLELKNFLARSSPVSCTVVSSRLASSFHRLPTLFRGFGAQSLYVQTVYIAAGCSSCCAPPRDPDAQSPLIPLTLHTAFPGMSLLSAGLGLRRDRRAPCVL